MSESNKFLVNEKTIVTAYQFAMVHGCDGDILGEMSRYLIKALSSQIENLEDLSEKYWDWGE